MEDYEEYEVSSFDAYCFEVQNRLTGGQYEEMYAKEHLFKKKTPAQKAEKAKKKAEKKAERKAKDNVFEKIGKAVGKAVKTVGEWGLLAPLKGAMKKALDKQGIAYKDKLEDIGEKFYNNIVKQGKGNYVTASHFDPVTIGVIISAIVAFFKGLKAKKEKGEPLSSWEEKALDTAEAATDTLVGAAKDQVKFEIGSFLTSPMGLIIIAVVFLMLRKK